MPYHNDLRPEDTQLIDALPSDHRRVVIALFKYSWSRYRKLRNLIIGGLVIVALGCAFGIQQGISLGKDQHKEDKQRIADNRNLITSQAVIIARQQKQQDAQDRLAVVQCWSAFDGRLVLRALIGGGIHAPITKDEIQLINNDPTFRALIILSARNNVAFKKYAFKLLPLPKCAGHNPNPALPKLLKAAGAPIHLKQ